MAVYCSQCGTKNEDDVASCVSCNATIARVMPNGGGAEAGDGFTRNISATNILIAGVCLIYLFNPTAGILELIPDVTPIIGNLDEMAAVIGLLMSLTAMGLIPTKWIALFEQFTGRRVV